MINYFESALRGGATAKNDNGAFHSLYSFVVTFGSSIYGTLLMMLIFLILIFTGIAFLRGYMAVGAPQKQQAKDMITRNFVILVLGVSLTGLIVTLFKLFSWS